MTWEVAHDVVSLVNAPITIGIVRPATLGGKALGGKTLYKAVEWKNDENLT
jgi:hypothetical protein